MRRADRLFQLVQLLSAERSVTAAQLAEELEVSARTIYRDIDDLSRSGVPIYGEVGIGYRLLPGYELPPLCFNREELEALLLGIRMVQAWGDSSLGQQARSAMHKIRAALPEQLHPELARQDILVPNFPRPELPDASLSALRKAVRERRKVFLAYRREDSTFSERILCPLGLFYWGAKWTLVAWCEMRDDFRHFRLDRMQTLSLLSSHFEPQVGRELKDFLKKTYGQ